MLHMNADSIMITGRIWYDSALQLFYVLQDRIPGETFVPKSSKEAEMERMLKSMEVTSGQTLL